MVIQVCANFTDVPANAWIGLLEIEDCLGLETLPAASALQRVIISGCNNLTRLPEGFRCLELEMPESRLRELPERLLVRKRLNLEGSRFLTSIPSLTIDELILRNCIGLSTLPPRLQARALDLSGCTRMRWPDDALIEVESLNLAGCVQLGTVPEYVLVSGEVDIANTGLRDLPPTLRHCRFAWNGVPVDERIAFRPETITAEEILEEDNAERRRVMLERFGLERFITEGEARIIESDRDPGGERQLLELPTAPGYRVLWVRCPSTQRAYFLRVPLWMRSCHEAAAWIAGFDNSAEYRPIKET